MLGFPNQVSDLRKLALGLSVHDHNDDVFGEALVRAGIAGTGHVPKPVDEYLAEQRRKTPPNQSHRTTARGLRELYRILGLIDDDGLTADGRRAVSADVEFWRRVIRDMTHGGSHPYQVLLHLVAKKPGITRAKCALALEARDDSAAELERIAALADLPEDEIRRRIGVTKSNWDNAKKILPRFAEQLGDVVRNGDAFYLAEAPGTARAPRASREVTPATIARVVAERPFDEVEVDPKAAAAAIASRISRRRRHDALVTELATRFAEKGARLSADPQDILARFGDVAILVEVKTLAGSEADERVRVREALSQLLYYEAFFVRDAEVRKVACFDKRISDAHAQFLNRVGIAAMWRDGARFAGDALAAHFVGHTVEELA